MPGGFLEAAAARPPAPTQPEIAFVVETREGFTLPDASRKTRMSEKEPDGREDPAEGGSALAGASGRMS